MPSAGPGFDLATAEYRLYICDPTVPIEPYLRVRCEFLSGWLIVHFRRLDGEQRRIDVPLSGTADAMVRASQAAMRDLLTR